MNFDEIKTELQNTKRTSFGISVPELKKLAKHVAKTNYESFLTENNFESFELKLFHAFLIGYIKNDIEILLKYFEDFIPQVDNWAVNDSLCQNFKIARKYPEIVWKFLMKYKNSKKEFESRIISVMLLSHYLNDKYIDNVITVLNQLNTHSYYAKMGVAWAFATIMGKYPNKCLNYLMSPKCSLDKSTFNKTLQKIKESYRVSEKIKLKIYKIKK